MALVFNNPSISTLVEHTLQKNLGKLSDKGALCVLTGKHTGRSAQDKYVVESAYSKESMNWANSINPMSNETFLKLEQTLLSEIKKTDWYEIKRSVGADPKWSLDVTLLTPGPSHALFFNYMFRDSSSTKSTLGQWQVIHCPWLEVDPKEFSLRSSTAIVINFEAQKVLVTGSAYAGEIKKSIFSVMNTLLPEKGIFPMHAGANYSEKAGVSVFFGLSGTGKTTLSTDEGMALIGDDEHGLTDTGIFNFEGGCYAKTYGLSLETEPDIFKACESFGTLLENVKLDEQTRTVNFLDKTLTENGRASYPLSKISGIKPDSMGPVPKNLFFLSADAFGVLPPVALLDAQQAMYFFLSGYTAKLAGTEIGIKEPVATFSTCFGAPFMMLKPHRYAELLKAYMEKNPMKVWLINTGWSGGGYGVGSRFPLKITRQVIRSIQQGHVNNAKFIRDEIFGFQTPTEVSGIDSKLLQPHLAWKNPDEYFKAAKKLKTLFDENYQKMSHK